MSQNIEKQILGMLLFDFDSCKEWYGNLKDEYFKFIPYKNFFRAIKILESKNYNIDASSVLEIEKRHDDVLSELISNTCTTQGFSKLVKQLVEINKIDDAKKKMETLIKNVDNDFGYMQLVTEIDKISSNLVDVSMDRGLIHISETAVEVNTIYTKISQGGSVGIRTGLVALESRGVYFRPKTLNIIAGRPGLGKTALALDIAFNSGCKTAFFSLEMSSDQLYERRVALLADLSSNQLRDKSVLIQSFEKIKLAEEEINKAQIWLDDSPYTTPKKIRRSCEKMIVERGLDLIVVDYVQIVGNDGDYEKKNEKIASVSHDLKAIAKFLNVPVIAVCQLNRECERENRRPRLSDLGESGSLDRDSDMVWMLYMENFDDKIDGGASEILIRKNRYGRCGKIDVYFNKQRTHYTDLEKYRGDQDFCSGVPMGDK